ncbi:hypothetical protein [Polyangium jinanense]|uniref:Uncharacterized protein n=1 Tax=Polyangium jinanense TaxID=2829994 RepID=A0A9X4AVQ4_9BACT|nr:hypothetical protein [Polyangium jinanense]MDC3960698.1 hypothetical protein [Polyangium jinanense]MDC3984530.1 hypothetical protein [Polyangium jinanense]
MKPHTARGHGGRLGVGGCTIVLALTWPSSSFAADEVPRHRVELTADRSLPGCSNPFDFSAILTNWLPVSTLDPTATRSLVVRIRRLPDGGKSVDTTITDEAGAVAHSEHHDYPPTDDCFKVLYWTAFDAAKRIRELAPPQEEEPAAPLPPEPAPPEPAPPKPAPAPPCPACPPPPKPPATPPMRGFVALGATISRGAAPEWGPGLRLAGGLQLASFTLELDGQWMPLLNTRRAGLTDVDIHTFGLTGAGCFKRAPLLGCLLVTGGIVGTVVSSRDYAWRGAGGFFGAGARTAVEFPLSSHLMARVDVEVALPLIGARLDFFGPSPWEHLIPVATGGGSLLYAF